MVAAANTVGVDVFAFVVTGNAFTAAANGETPPRPMRRTRTSCAPTSDWLPHPDARADPDRRVDRHRHRRARANRLDAVATYFGLIEGATADDERLAELATALTDKELRDCLTTEVKDGRMNGPLPAGPRGCQPRRLPGHRGRAAPSGCTDGRKALGTVLDDGRDHRLPREQHRPGRDRARRLERGSHR